MNQIVSLPVKMTPPAAARVAELGLHETVDRLAAQALRLLPGLHALELAVVPSYEMDEAPWLVFECHSDQSERDARDAVVDWYTWRAEKLPFDVGRHFMLSWVPCENANRENAHAG